jgi:hypothetical protein
VRWGCGAGGDWSDPEAGEIRFGDYAADWISEHVFKPRTRSYTGASSKNHLAPAFGSKDLRDSPQADIPHWRK